MIAGNKILLVVIEVLLKKFLDQICAIWYNLVQCRRKISFWAIYLTVIHSTGLDYQFLATSDVNAECIFFWPGIILALYQVRFIQSF
jgi:DMSO/TMAO reductase YedYZ heme-binding membrane subunit